MEFPFEALVLAVPFRKLATRRGAGLFGPFCSFVHAGLHNLMILLQLKSRKPLCSSTGPADFGSDPRQPRITGDRDKDALVMRRKVTGAAGDPTN